jgi:hypothetical protein
MAILKILMLELRSSSWYCLKLEVNPFIDKEVREKNINLKQGGNNSRWK